MLASTKSSFGGDRKRCDQVGLLACESVDVPVQDAVRGYVRVSRYLLCSMPVDEPASLFVEALISPAMRASSRAVLWSSTARRYRCSREAFLTR
jgi:hypothetical protein